MCILKIHADDLTANCIQSVAHNLDTTLGDIDMLYSILKSRGLDITECNLVKLHIRKSRERMFSLWEQYIENPPDDLLPHETVNMVPIDSDMDGSEFVLVEGSK